MSRPAKTLGHLVFGPFMLIINPVHCNKHIRGGQFVKSDVTHLSQDRHRIVAFVGDLESMQSYRIRVGGGSRFLRALAAIGLAHPFCFNLLPGRSWLSSIADRL
jgi:hypothetical protein